MAGLRRIGYSTLVYQCTSGTKSRRLPKVRFSQKTGSAGECQQSSQKMLFLAHWMEGTSNCIGGGGKLFNPQTPCDPGFVDFVRKPSFEKSLCIPGGRRRLFFYTKRHIVIIYLDR